MVKKIWGKILEKKIWKKIRFLVGKTHIFSTLSVLRKKYGNFFRGAYALRPGLWKKKKKKFQA